MTSMPCEYFHKIDGEVVKLNVYVLMMVLC